MMNLGIMPEMMLFDILRILVKIFSEKRMLLGVSVEKSLPC